MAARDITLSFTCREGDAGYKVTLSPSTRRRKEHLGTLSHSNCYYCCQESDDANHTVMWFIHVGARLHFTHTDRCVQCSRQKSTSKRFTYLNLLYTNRDLNNQNGTAPSAKGLARTMNLHMYMINID